MLIKQYKFISIKQINKEEFEGKPVYRIFGIKTDTQIGILSMYKPWKKYVFSSQPECVFDTKCLSDVLDFMTNEI